jgi:hypothetical protein
VKFVVQMIGSGQYLHSIGELKGGYKVADWTSCFGAAYPWRNRQAFLDFASHFNWQGRYRCIEIKEKA